jgi:hypothetical protein
MKVGEAFGTKRSSRKPDGATDSGASFFYLIQSGTKDLLTKINLR